MSMNKVVSQGHLVLTAGADGFAKIWVSGRPGGVPLPTLSRMLFKLGVDVR
jgi:hypothetical protein